MRSALFNAGLLLWCLFCFVFCLPLLAGPVGWVRKAGAIWIKGILFLLRHCIGLRHREIGRENIPSGPALYASMHQSAWETLVLTLAVPNGIFVLKRELLWLPFLGWYLKKTGQIAIDRGAGAKALKSLLLRSKKAIEAGRSPIIFPEGTRVAPGQSRPYQPGIAALYQHLQLPVIPVALNSGLYWPRNSFSKKPGEITLQFLPAIAPGLERRQFMKELKDRMDQAGRNLLAGN